jgi:hypothetical protein
MSGGGNSTRVTAGVGFMQRGIAEDEHGVTKVPRANAALQS